MGFMCSSDYHTIIGTDYAYMAYKIFFNYKVIR